MLVSATKLIGYPVLSLHVGGAIAWAGEQIVDPETLKIVAMRAEGPLVKNDPEAGEWLETRDVREFSELGMVVDGMDVFVNAEDVIKLEKLLSLQFYLIGLKVETKKKSKLGKVIDYTVDTNDFSVRQLIVKRPVMKSLVDPELVIPRKEIIEVNDYKIIVKDEEEKIKKTLAKEEFIPNFVNPFREPDFSVNRFGKEK